MPLNLSLGLNLGSAQGGAGASFANAYAAAWWAALPTALKTGYEAYIPIYDAFGVAISDDVFAKLDTLYLLATHDTSGYVHLTDSACLLNWVNPATYKCTLVTTPVVTKHQGVSGAGSSALNTNLKYAAGVKHSLNSMTIGIWVYAMADENGKIQYDATSGTARSAIAQRQAATASYGGVNSDLGVFSPIPTPATGLTTLRRANPTQEQIIKGKSFASISTRTRNSVDIVDNLHYICGERNSANNLSGATSDVISLAFCGAALDNADIEKINDAMTALLAAMAAL